MEHLSWRSVDVSLERPIDSQELNGVYAKFGKRLFDIVFALLLFPVALPVTGLLWALTKCDGGPGFFGHVRIGQNGKAFKCWKIRSMVVDAEKKLKAHLEQNPDAAAEWAKDFKLEKDPRITQLGRFLRKSSLDELPQIWNVLKGEMSFVGPRPIIEAELVKYGGYQWAYLAATPGVTGVWQVSGRNDVSYDERVRMDAEYLEKRSFLFDCAIMLKTVGAVLNRTGK
ncbi:exopolysaccharide biosynthesis protein [Actibacterium sp. EMB200-NS6]|nr:exopolysaccharide biosynthesis protein [Actibacterium sp. EMB200-NS6]